MSVDTTTRRSRPWVLLAFAGLTFGLAVAKAFGAEVDYELILLTAGIAGLDSVRGLAAQVGAAVVRRRSEPPLAEPPADLEVPPSPDLPYEAIPHDDAPWAPAVDAFEVLSPELLAVALHGTFVGGGEAGRFGALEHADKVRWLAVAERVIGLAEGDPEALDEALGLVADAAGAPAPVGPTAADLVVPSRSSRRAEVA